MKLTQLFSSCVLALVLGQAAFAADFITVVDENQQPVSGATVMIGQDRDNPFAGNVITTDSSGRAAVPAAWTAALPVSAQAPGFIATTLPTSAPGALTIQVSKEDGQTQIEIKGNTTNFGRLVDDGNVHFGLVMPAIQRSKFLNFDISSVVSPQADTLEILGRQFDIPSNLTLPDQTVTYIFEINLNKPNYRSYVRNPGHYLMSAIHGKFPFRKVVDAIRGGKSMFDVINDFTFLEKGEFEVDVSNKGLATDLAVNQTQFAKSVQVKAPSFANNQVMISLSMDEKNGLLAPTDLKRFTPGQSISLKTPSASPSVLSLLMMKPQNRIESLDSIINPLNVVDSYFRINGLAPDPAAFQQLSFNMMSASSSVAPQFYDLIAKPSVKNNVITIAAPKALAGVNPAGMYMVLSEITTSGSGNGVQVEQRTRVWELWSKTWLTQVQLPKLNVPVVAGHKYRWEVFFLGQSSTLTGGSNVNGVDLNSVTHVTRNGSDL